MLKPPSLNFTQGVPSGLRKKTASAELRTPYMGWFLIPCSTTVPPHDLWSIVSTIADLTGSFVTVKGLFDEAAEYSADPA